MPMRRSATSMLLWLWLPLCGSLLVPMVQQRTPLPVVPTAQQRAPRAATHDVQLQDSAGVLFPTTGFIADAAANDATDEEMEGKARGRIILGVIVANSVFWQYLLPLIKGQPTSTGRKKR